MILDIFMFFVCELFDISLSSFIIIMSYRFMDRIIIQVKVYVEESESSLFYEWIRESSSNCVDALSRNITQRDLEPALWTEMLF